MKYSAKDTLSRLAVCLNIAPGIKFSHIDTIVFILLRCENVGGFFLPSLLFSQATIIFAEISWSYNFYD